MTDKPQKPMSITEAGNFAKSQEFKAPEKPPITMVTPQMRAIMHKERGMLLMNHLVLLENDMQRKVLEARIKGLNHQQIAYAIKERVGVVEAIERNAISFIKNKLEQMNIGKGEEPFSAPKDNG